MMEPTERAINVCLFLALTLVWPGLIVASYWRIDWEYSTASAVIYVGLLAGLATLARTEP